MNDLFTSSGRQALKDFAQDDLLCLFDFDGTLVPLEPHPEKVRVPAIVLDRLQRLQERTSVGIVTGRGLADMHRMLEFKPDFLLGNHGIEGLPGWEMRTAEYEQICKDWHTQLTPQLAMIDKEIWIEYKKYSISVHYIHSTHLPELSATLTTLFETLSPQPRVIGGRQVFNLLPPNATDKGRAVNELMAVTGASCALYAGDDVTDEHVFELNRDDLFTIRVGASSHSAAKYQIADHVAVVSLMDMLIEYLPHRRT